MFEHQSKCKMMAMALVAMLAFCSVSVMLTDSDAAGNNKTTYNDGIGWKDPTFFEIHGYQFILFAIASIILVILVLLGYGSPEIIVAAVILAILAILCYFYKDISGIIGTR